MSNVLDSLIVAGLLFDSKALKACVVAKCTEIRQRNVWTVAGTICWAGWVQLRLQWCLIYRCAMLLNWLVLTADLIQYYVHAVQRRRTSVIVRTGPLHFDAKCDVISSWFPLYAYILQTLCIFSEILFLHFHAVELKRHFRSDKIVVLCTCSTKTSDKCHC